MPNKGIASGEDLNRYRTIYADPPWNESGGGQICRGAQRHYDLMRTEDICNLPVQLLADDNAHLYLWVTNNFLRDGFRVCDAWGFRYVTLITWVKDRQGLGQYFRGITEQCIFAVRGSLPYRTREDGKRAQGVTVIDAPRREHSQKPDEMRRMIECVSHPPYVELFAREQATGWDVFGNEVESTVALSVNDAPLLNQPCNSVSVGTPDTLDEPNLAVQSRLEKGRLENGG